MKSEANLYSRTFGNHYFVIAISFVLIFILMITLMNRLVREFDQAKEVQYSVRLAELKAAVRLMEAALFSQGEMDLAYKFEGANPMDWLEDKTSHYLGVMQPSNALEHPGYWFFDAERKEIGFVPSTEAVTEINAESRPKILRFKVRALRSKEINSKYTGLVLAEVTKE